MNKLKIFLRTLQLSLQMKSNFSKFFLLLSLPAAFLPIIVSIKMQNLTDALVAVSENKVNISYCISILLQLSLFFLFQVVYGVIHQYVREEDCILGAEYILKNVIRSKCEVEYGFIENKDKYLERIARIEKFAKERIIESVATVMDLFSVFITLVGSVLLLSKVNLLIIIIVLLVSFSSAYICYKQNNESFFWDLQWGEDGALANYFYRTCTEEDFIYDLRHYRLYPFLKSKWKCLTDEHEKFKRKMLLKNFTSNSIADIVRGICYVLVIIVTVKKIYLSPYLGVGLFTLVYALTSQLQNAAMTLLNGIALFIKYIPYMEEYFYVQDLDKEKQEMDSTLMDNGDIKFENVSFTYPEAEHEALHNISISINDGEKIAIVGENGSGKSTFIALICGMLRPNTGSIYVGGCNVTRESKRVRNSISVVFQNFAHYADTLRNNIKVSDSEKDCSDREIIKLMKKIHMDEFLNTESGLDVKLGSYSESGNDLSGGQWQKIAIVRAGYRDRGRIMIFDEPTSALDPIAETQLYSDFSRLTENKTTLLISHRLGITSLVDRILVFKNGEIVEDGTHDELVKKNGIYKEMYYAQAKWYK